MERHQKVKLNYYTVLIDANDVRIIMIIVIILTIDNSPILSIRLIRLGQLRNDLSFSLTLALSVCLFTFTCLSVCLIVCLSIYLSIYLSIDPSIVLSICLRFVGPTIVIFYLSNFDTNTSVASSLYLSVCLFVCLFVLFPSCSWGLSLFPFSFLYLYYISTLLIFLFRLPFSVLRLN